MNKEAYTYCLSAVAATAPTYLANVMEADREKLTQDVPWVATDRNVVERALQNVLQAGVAHTGLPAVELPAEFVAAGIAIVVHPINYLVCCAWVGQKLSIAAESQGVDESRQNVAP